MDVVLYEINHIDIIAIKTAAKTNRAFVKTARQMDQIHVHIHLSALKQQLSKMYLFHCQ